MFSLRASTLQKERSSTRSLASVLRIKCIFLLRKKQNCQYPGFYHLFLRLVAGCLCLLEKKHGQALARCPTTLASGTVATGAMCPLQPCAGAQQAGPAASGPGWEEYGQAGAQPPLCPPRGRAAAPSGQRLCSAAAGGVFQLAAHGGAPCSPTKPTSAIGAQQKYPKAPWLRCRLQDPGPASPLLQLHWPQTCSLWLQSIKIGVGGKGCTRTSYLSSVISSRAHTMIFSSPPEQHIF